MGKIRKNKKTKIIENKLPTDENIPLAATRISDERVPNKVNLHNL